MPGAHEFAVKPPPQGKTKRGSRADLALGVVSVIANGDGMINRRRMDSVELIWES